MEMKWHPIIDGDMEELNKSAQYIFTVEIIQMDGNSRRLVTIGAPYDMSCMKFTHPDVREVEYKAWAEVPEPFTPNDCNRCEHLEEWCDEFGAGRWCELLKNVPFTKIKPGDCPLNR